MEALDLCVFLTSFTVLVAFATLLDFMRSRRVISLIAAVVALTAVVVTTVVGFRLEPGKSYLQLIRVLIYERDISALLSMTLGVAAALPWWTNLVATRSTSALTERAPILRDTLVSLLSIVAVCLVVTCCELFIWKQITGFERDPAARIVAAEFEIEQIADLDFAPLRIAINEQGKIYITYDYFETWGTMGGSIVELSLNGDTDRYQQRIVADSTLLMRSYGLIARDGHLYVSRTGIHPKATQGDVTYESTGAVTQLSDLDGDGYFEFAHDILTGLPGARGPDTMQQNNGMAFAPDGSLLITTATCANRSLDQHPWAGCVLRLSPDFSTCEVFAQGFRNPFGIVIGPDGEPFVTDNDIDENPGDELNHVIQGEHYGHPFVVPHEDKVDAEGFREPILVSDLESNYLGLAYATSESLPEPFRNCLYMADYMGDQILRLRLEKDADTYRVAETTTLARLTTPLDVAVAPNGDLFVITRRTNNVYRIRQRSTTR